MRDALSRLPEHWAVGRAIATGGASEEEIQAFQNTYEVQMPGDLYRYFREVNGMRPDWRYDQDDNGFTFWALSRVQPLSVVTARGSVDWSDSKLNSNDTQYFVFADYLGESWWYASDWRNDLLAARPLLSSVIPTNWWHTPFLSS